MKKQIKLLLLAGTLAFLSCTDKKEFNILNYGAIGDNSTLNTEAIQKAINACHEKGGGKVIIPKGTFLSGTIYMKHNVNLHLEAEAILKGSPSFKDYPDNEVKYINSFSHRTDRVFGNKALLFGEGVKNISITGSGTIDGSGDSPEFQLGNDSNFESRSRPCMLLFIDSKNIKVYDLNLRNSAYWLQNYLGCETLHLKGLNIYNHTNFNQDATDIDARNVLIEDCVIDADDDGICLKSHDPNRIVENVVVRNCTIASNCNAVKFGTKSDGGFKDIYISNCFIRKASEDNVRKWQEALEFIELPTTVISGFALESVDGGIIENVQVSDIEMEDVQTPIFIIMGRRNVGQAGNDEFYNSENTTPDPALAVGKVSNISFKNITARSHSKMASSITSVPGHYIENISLENIKISSMGNGTRREAGTELTEYNGFYPENRMYGFVYPASGFYLRHIKNITLKNVELEVRNKDYRSPVILDNVKTGVIEALSATPPAGGEPVIQIKRSKDISIKENRSNHQPLVATVDTDPSEIKIQ